MIPLVIAVVGVGALAGGWLTLRRLGERARIGRILAATPVVTVTRARAIAGQGASRYVGVQGRIDSEQPFEDEDERPLVYRRRRLETRSGSAWTAVEDVRQAVPFEVSEGLDTIAVDGDTLDVGLIVVAREAVGTAGEIPDRLPANLPPETPVRLRIELVSSVDHALALGVPTLDPSRGPMLKAGLGRPLILTNLERDEALRLLAVGGHRTARLASILLAAGVALLGVAVAWYLVAALIPATALAASPAPTGQPVGDPRSSGQGPGLVGDPLTAILAVAAIAALAVVASLIYVRATSGREARPRR